MIIQINDLKSNVKRIVIEFDDSTIDEIKTQESVSKSNISKSKKVSSVTNLHTNEENNEEVIDFKQFETSTDKKDEEVSKPNIPDISERKPKVSKSMQNLTL